MKLETLKAQVKAQNMKSSDRALEIMRTQGCSSCCSMGDGGNSKEMK
ncbi:hypothetical protein NI389_03920 [Pseudoalteromonas xiamenensis]|nr:hypothetical protein [Pseudoalteromonas xiamenensis]WMN60560.1 hypothetical protein NI389_03920 [Pseudoalteromonas xiamenensis]